MKVPLILFKLGSTTFRALVFRNINGSWRKVGEIRKAVRLNDCKSPNLLNESSLIGNLNELMMELPPSSIRIGVATGLFRTSSNAPQLLDRVRSLYNLHVVIASEAEEVQMARRAASLSLGHSRFLLADIGGGSTEISYSDTSFVNLPWGTTNLTVNPVELHKELAYQVKRLDKVNVEHMPLLACGSIVSSILKRTCVQHDSSADCRRISLAAVADLARELTAVRRLSDSCDTYRLLAGSIILEQVMRVLNKSSVQVLSVSVADGILDWLLQHPTLNKMLITPTE